MSYLLDTNTVIDFANRLLPKTAVVTIAHQSSISFITRIELLAWPHLNDLDKIVYEKFISAAYVYGCEEPIILKTIEIRKQFKLKLPDAMIAATALVNNLTLLTRNLKDFKNIANLSTIDPHTL